MLLLQCKQIVRKVVFNEKIMIIELHKLYYVLVYDLVLGPRVVFNEKIVIIELHKLYYVLVYDLVLGPRL